MGGYWPTDDDFASDDPHVRALAKHTVMGRRGRLLPDADALRKADRENRPDRPRPAEDDPSDGS